MKTKSIWNNPEIVLRATKMLQDGASGAETARTISDEFQVRITRSAVLGFAHRNGRKLQNLNRTKPRRGPDKNRRIYVYKGPTSTVLVVSTDTDVSRLDSIPLSKLDAHKCRWPFGDKAPYMFCGNESYPGLPYCAHHAKIAYK